jgi:hypothetical protein
MIYLDSSVPLAQLPAEGRYPPHALWQFEAIPQILIHQRAILSHA